MSNFKILQENYLQCLYHQAEKKEIENENM